VRITPEAHFTRTVIRIVINLRGNIFQGVKILHPIYVGAVWTGTALNLEFAGRLQLGQEEPDVAGGGARLAGERLDGRVRPAAIIVGVIGYRQHEQERRALVLGVFPDVGAYLDTHGDCRVVGFGLLMEPPFRWAASLDSWTSRRDLFMPAVAY
jgi:hypothetical protein